MSPVEIRVGDCLDALRSLDAGCVQTCVTSPPYFGLRDYGVAGQIGLEPTPDEYVAKLVAVFREVRRVLADDGTLWLNLGDSYSRMQPDNVPQSKNRRVMPPSMRERIVDLKPKNLIGIPWRVAFALQADGWYLRSDIIWHKPNPMPESVTDRPTKAHEYLFLLAKSERYYYDATRCRGAMRSTRRDMLMRSAVRETERMTARRGQRTTLRFSDSTFGPRVQGTQPPHRLDRRHAALQRRPLRDVPARADRAVHPRRALAWRHGARPIRRRGHDGTRCRSTPARAVDRTQPRVCEASPRAH
jgi:hypothetical protein